jgi:signal transduction histidine kinase
MHEAFVRDGSVMMQDRYKRPVKQWEKVRGSIETADVAFIFLRLIIFCGGIAWIFFSHISQNTYSDVSKLFIGFFAYSALIYLWFFLSPERKRIIYIFFLFFDFLFTSLLVRLTGGFDSHFVIGFYLMTALYSFYYGLVRGAFIGAIATVLYMVSGNFDLDKHYWADHAISIASLFLLAIPIGMLSQKLKRDGEKITNLNKDLNTYIEELQKVHGRLIQVEKMSELGRMAADVAHEIRNPLTSIGGFARRLEHKLSQITNAKECITTVAKEKEHADIIISEVNRLERILRDILSFSREAKYNFEHQGINGIVQESLKAYADICNEQTIQIEEEFHASLPEILIDRDHFKQAVNNLISNAVGAMPEGGTMQLKTSRENIHHASYVSVEVADTGHGIPADKLTMIFEPFYSSKQIGAGTGLGLAICKKIIDEHRGLIRVESELNKGTRFKLSLPYQNREDKSKIKCWEFQKCGVEKIEGAALNKCPAYPNYGRICWAVAGTYCCRRVEGAIAEQLGDCEKCEFYKRVVVLRDL